jgi:DNA-binding transcriptional ArsR family regulator
MVERQETLDRTYAALSHPTRRAMLALVRREDLRVTEIAEPFDMSLAAASKHVAALERAGLLRRTVRGRDHELSLQPEPLEVAADWFEPYRAFWETRLDALARHLGELP